MNTTRGTASPTDRSVLGLRVLLVAASIAIAPNIAAAGRAEPPAPPAPPWDTFVKADGHANEIPAQWLDTPEGRFAHSIRLPDSIPKTVPFDFGKARLKALAPGSHGVARQYWEHLCATEAGSFILETVDNVEGFAFLRAVGGMSEQELRDRWKKEAPRLQSDYGWRYDPLAQAKGYVDPPGTTYVYVEYPDPERSGSFLKLSGYVSRQREFTVERVRNPTSRYAVTWRGIHRPRDRECLISGYEWIVLDRDSGETLAVFRDFGITGYTSNEKEGIYWLNAGSCAFRKSVFGRTNGVDAPVWIPRVLKPSTYPGVLRFIDKLKGETK